MEIELAKKDQLLLVKQITQETIRAVYPKYYPAGAVKFFLAHHCDEPILEDLEHGRVFLCKDSGAYVGTVTVKENEICRLFVLPEYQHKGYGKCLLDFAEQKIFEEYDRIDLDASLSAKPIYRLRGYVEKEYHVIDTENGDKLCYDVMSRGKC